MDYMEFSGKTVEDALTDALVSMGLTSDQIEYEVIEKGGSGLFSFKKQAKIRVRKKVQPAAEEAVAQEAEAIAAEEPAVTEAPAAEEAAETEPAEETEPARTAESVGGEAEEISEEMLQSKKETVSDFLGQVFRAMNMDVELIFHDSEEDNTIDIELSGNDMGVLIGKRGQTLDALQYLTNLAVNKHSDHYTRIKLDAEDYRNRRQRTLENLAKNIAYKVKKTNRPVKLEPMNPFERRVIHCALQDDRYVETYSEGEEPYRFVVVAPKR